MTNNKYYNYKDLEITLSYTPINTHLCVQYGTYLYIVPLQNTLTIRKIDTSDGSSSLIVTEAGAITKFYIDRANDLLYYYHNQSTFSYVDLSDDSITDLDDTLDACEDLFVYDGSLFAVDTSQDDLTFYKYTPGSPGTWGAVGTVAEGESNSFDIGALGDNDNTIDICWDGTYFYITDFNDGVIYKYNSALDTLIDSFDIGALGGNDVPLGICWDGTYFYVTDNDDSVVYKYNSDLDTLIDSFDVGALGGNDHPTGICWDGTYFYIADSSDAYIYKYNADLDTLIDSFDIGTLSGSDSPVGIEWDGTYFYVVALSDTHIYKYNSDLDTLIDSFDIGALGGNDNPYGICWDGIFFYVVDNVDTSVYKYHSDLITDLGKILYSTVISNDVYVVYQYITGDCKIYTKDLDNANNPTLLETLTSGYTIPYLEDQRGVSLSNDNDVLYFVLKKESDELTYLCSYEITADSFSIGSEFNIALMLDRNTDSTANPPFNLEKGFHLTLDKVYQIPTTYTGKLNWISNFNFSDTIIAITDHYLIDDSGNLYEMVDMIAEHAIFRAEMTHERQNYSTMKLKYNSDLITIVPQMFLQIIGYHTISGSTNSNQVIFEGIAKKPTKGRVQHVLIVNQASEMDQVKAKGSKSGRTDQIISDIHDDGAPNGSSYIQDGTLSSGTAMGDKEVDGKKLRTLYDDYAENDGFTWALRPQGQFDYNDGSIDSGADIRYDGSTYTDTIRHLQAWKVSKINQIIVNGSINSSKGEVYTGQWNDEEDQQINGINSITIEDASLDSNALCQSKADTLGANETEITRCQFKFKKASYGLIQPGQTITFKYDITNYITIAEAQFVVDFIMIELISEVGYMEISSAV